MHSDSDASSSSYDSDDSDSSPFLYGPKKEKYYCVLCSATNEPGQTAPFCKSCHTFHNNKNIYMCERPGCGVIMKYDCRWGTPCCPKCGTMRTMWDKYYATYSAGMD